MNNTTTFSLSEEAFLLSSLKEVTKVCARASGKASFNLSVQDGQAHLQLGFQLGLPGDDHLPPQPHHHDLYPHRRKGSVRKERDRIRAAEHQARIKSEEVILNPAPKLVVSANNSPSLPTTVSSTVHTPITAASVAPKATISFPSLAASAAINSVAAPVTSPVKTAKTSPTPVSTVSATSSNISPSPDIFPSRPVRPFCQPDKRDPLKELHYFIDDLRLKVHFVGEKDFKVKHKKIVIAFAAHAKDNPDLLFNYKNYEETFINFCEEKDKILYRKMFKNYYNEI